MIQVRFIGSVCCNLIKFKNGYKFSLKLFITLYRPLFHVQRGKEATIKQRNMAFIDPAVTVMNMSFLKVYRLVDIITLNVK
jgi:hypothetical protein